MIYFLLLPIKMEQNITIFNNRNRVNTNCKTCKPINDFFNLTCMQTNLQNQSIQAAIVTLKL